MPVTDTQDKIIFTIASLFFTITLSSATKPDGGDFGWFNKDKFLAGRATPCSILSYFPAL